MSDSAANMHANMERRGEASAVPALVEAPPVWVAEGPRERAWSLIWFCGPYLPERKLPYASVEGGIAGRGTRGRLQWGYDPW